MPSYTVLVAAVGLVGFGAFAALGGAFRTAIADGATPAAPPSATRGTASLQTQFAQPNIGAQASTAEALARIAREAGGYTEKVEALWKGFHSFFEEPELHVAVGGRPIQTVLVEGAEGSGKSHIVNATAREIGANVVRPNMATLIDFESVPGVERELDKLFAGAKANGKTVLALDLERVLARQREGINVQFFWERLNTLLRDLHPADDVFVVGEARSADELARAAGGSLDMSQFRRTIQLADSSQSDVRGMLTSMTDGMNLTDDVDLAEVAQHLGGGRTPGDLRRFLQRVADSARDRLASEVEANPALRPAKLVDEGAIALPAIPSPDIADWGNADEIATTLAFYVNNYALPEEQANGWRTAVAQLRELGDSHPLPKNEEFEATFAQTRQQAINGDLEPSARRVQAARRAALREAFDTTESSFPVTRTDFLNALEKFESYDKTNRGQYL
ncbi:MAG: AAA family ATPase [Polyangiales bacterium]